MPGTARLARYLDATASVTRISAGSISGCGSGAASGEAQRARSVPVDGDEHGARQLTDGHVLGDLLQLERLLVDVLALVGRDDVRVDRALDALVRLRLRAVFIEPRLRAFALATCALAGARDGRSGGGPIPSAGGRTQGRCAAVPRRSGRS